MSIISISATKAQKDGAKYLFGTKGESILAVLEALSKAKELRSSHLNGLIVMLKDAEDDELIKFKNSAGGKRTIEAAKLLATAKTLGTSLKGLRGIKVPSKWINDHDDAKAAGAEETKMHRATGKGTRPQKAQQVANPQAPEAEEIDDEDNDFAQYSDLRRLAGQVGGELEEFGFDVKVTGHKARGSEGPYLKINGGRKLSGQVSLPYSKAKGSSSSVIQINVKVDGKEEVSRIKGLGLIEPGGTIADVFAELVEKLTKNPAAPAAPSTGMNTSFNYSSIDPNTGNGLKAVADKINSVLNVPNTPIRFVAKFLKSEPGVRITAVEDSRFNTDDAYLSIDPAEGVWWMYAVNRNDKRGAGIRGEHFGKTVNVATVLDFMARNMTRGSGSQKDIRSMIGNVAVSKGYQAGVSSKKI